MRKDFNALYVAILDNRVIHFETNLSLFVDLVNKSITGSRNYDWFYRQFQKQSFLSANIGGKDYYFQKLI